jgi:hypothetical protein
MITCIKQQIYKQAKVYVITKLKVCSIVSYVPLPFQNNEHFEACHIYCISIILTFVTSMKKEISC